MGLGLGLGGGGIGRLTTRVVTGRYRTDGVNCPRPRPPMLGRRALLGAAVARGAVGDSRGCWANDPSAKIVWPVLTAGLLFIKIGLVSPIFGNWMWPSL